MTFGLRVQIVLLLGGLMVLAFGPLFHAVATYSSFALFSIRQDQARKMARGVTERLGLEQETSRATLEQRVERELRASHVLAIAIIEPPGKPFLGGGDATTLRAIAEHTPSVPGRVHDIVFDGRKAASVRYDVGGQAVVAAFDLDDYSEQAARLVRLLSLYMGLLAIALLIAAYFALTYLIIRPLGVIVSAAERVAGGSRRFEFLTGGPRELAILGTSLRTMTERLVRDEEALRRKVEEVEAATQQLFQAQERLVRSERLASVGRLAAGLAHEVGNPISAMLGLQDLVLTGDLDPGEQRDFVERMKRETERIHGILHDLLQFARPAANEEAGGSPGSVPQAIEETLALVKPQKALQGVEVHLGIDEDLPLVTLSGERLVQVLLNLLLNAADACNGAGTITVEARVVEATGVKKVKLSVSDDGVGVPPELEPRMFEPFVTTKDVGRGSGLGLAVCRGLVEAVGGSIGYDRNRTRGARFVVELPGAP